MTVTRAEFDELAARVERLESPPGLCDARSADQPLGFYCSLEAGHPPPHIARVTDGRVAATWGADSSIAKTYVLAIDWTSDHSPLPFRSFPTEADAHAWVEANPPAMYADYVLYEVSADGEPGTYEDRPDTIVDEWMSRRD